MSLDINMIDFTIEEIQIDTEGNPAPVKVQAYVVGKKVKDNYLHSAGKRILWSNSTGGITWSEDSTNWPQDFTVWANSSTDYTNAVNFLTEELNKITS